MFILCINLNNHLGLRNSTIIAVMLSFPWGIPTYFDKFSSKKLSNTLEAGTSSLRDFLNFLNSKSTSFSYYLYHIPSQATTKNYSVPSRSISFNYGMQVIGCWLNGIPGTALSLKSPIALVKFRFPLTLPSIIFPPLLMILSYSLFSEGL